MNLTSDARLERARLTLHDFCLWAFSTRRLSTGCVDIGAITALLDADPGSRERAGEMAARYSIGMTDLRAALMEH